MHLLTFTQATHELFSYVFFCFVFYYSTEIVAGDLLCKGRGRAEVIVAVIIHSGSFLKQLLYRLNPHYLGFQIFIYLFFFTKAFAEECGEFLTCFTPPLFVLFLCE